MESTDQVFQETVQKVIARKSYRGTVFSRRDKLVMQSLLAAKYTHAEGHTSLQDLAKTCASMSPKSLEASVGKLQRCGLVAINEVGQIHLRDDLL